MTADWLLLTLALILAALLIVGLVQALRVPRRGSRRVRSRSARRVGPRSARRVPDRSLRPRFARAPAHEPAVPPPPPEPASSVPREETPTAGEAAPSPGVEEVVPAAEPPLVSSAPPEESPLPSDSRALALEECRRLYGARRHRELLALADGYLHQAPGGVESEVAELWSLVGRARQALGDEDGARAAFEEALCFAPDADLPVYQRQLAAMTVAVGERLLARVERVESVTREERIVTLRRAVRWLKQGARAVPDTENLASSLARALQGLWAAYGETATALLQRREFSGGRRLLQEALSDDDFPAEQWDAFRDLLAAACAGEVEQVVARAIRSLGEHREQEALALLRRAEGILASIPAEAIAKEWRQEMNRQLWWGYSRLGLRGLAAGEFETALEPLFRALRIDEVDSERQAEAHAALIRALDHVIKDRAARIGELLAAGKLETAVAEGDWLREAAEEGRKLGVREEDLTAALALARPIMARLDRTRSAASG